ncbi:MAG: pentapeptide repeat-containing protein [Ardenticatenaceae bacterium]|nr:pentapeptide repeat-containing protein [Ardenticatenaceae bacterium]
MNETHLNGSNAENANLGNAELVRAVLRRARLEGADLKGANLTGADFTKAYLKGARNVEASRNLNEARGIQRDRGYSTRYSLRVVFFVGLLSVLGLLCWLGGLNYDTGNDKTAGSTGSEARLQAGGKWTWVARDRQAYEEYGDAAVRDDTYGLRELIATGRIFPVPNGTRVLILDHGGFLYSATKVRILEGEHTGRSGWVPSEWVR